LIAICLLIAWLDMLTNFNVDAKDIANSSG